MFLTFPRPLQPANKHRTGAMLGSSWPNLPGDWLIVLFWEGWLCARHSIRLDVAGVLSVPLSIPVDRHSRFPCFLGHHKDPRPAKPTVDARFHLIFWISLRSDDSL